MFVLKRMNARLFEHDRLRATNENPIGAGNHYRRENDKGTMLR